MLKAVPSSIIQQTTIRNSLRLLFNLQTGFNAPNLSKTFLHNFRSHGHYNDNTASSIPNIIKKSRFHPAIITKECCQKVRLRPIFPPFFRQYSTPSTHSATNNTATSSQTHLSMADRLKQLTRQYGLGAVFVYVAISTIDLGITFVAVRTAGTERVKKAEDWMMENFGGWITIWRNRNTDEKNANEDTSGTETRELEKMREAEREGKPPSWASIFVIAYGIHKVLVPLRLGLTAAVTPPLVKRLRKMGWNIGRKLDRR
ncbi:1151_t:CDS:1 [Paraglomus occultum]|uniref:1151_t:CDS:1 n=1 Tax=Paraglomus occultum TaxID=144539 RepID=A0A9N9CQD6_9GLOM|nr:1151_t:CDS:1 [Paraglomus occultum]